MAGDGARSPEAKAVRLFVAVDLPAGAERALEATVAPLRTAIPRARWVPRENRHVTLRFLGRTASRLVPWVREALARVAAARGPIPTALTGLGSFPSTTRTRVLWAGLDDAAGTLGGLAAALDDALEERFPTETRPFTAHLTLARSEPPLRLDPAVLATPLTTPVFTIDRLVLYRSHLGRPAPRYEALGTFPLSGPA